LPEEYNDEVRGASVMLRHIDKNEYQAYVKGKDMLYLIALHVDEAGRWEANDIYVYKQRVEYEIDDLPERLKGPHLFSFFQSM
jgi:hypothetical protein